VVKEIKNYLTQSTPGIFLFFVIKVIVFFFLFDYFFEFLIGASIEGGIYWPVLAKFNLAEGYRDFLLNASSAIIRLLGYDTHIDGKHLFILYGGGINLGYSCYGFGVISALMALILAYPKEIRQKIRFVVIGLLGIIVLNIIRIISLTIVYTEIPRDNLKNVDHHLIFNIVVYILVFGIFFWYVEKGKQPIVVNKD